MDTRSRKWTNKVLITLVMIAMTLSGIYGLDTINNMAVTGDNSFSLDEQDQSDYIKNTQMSLFDKWADQEGDKVYYTQANHVSESLLNKIKKESFVKVTMKVKPYDKKMVTTTSTYGTENANYTGGRIEHFHIERGKTEKLNKDGSFKGWDPYDEYDEYNADQTEYYEFYGDNYTLQDIFPEQLLINDEKNQRLENADIEISLTKKALTEIENFRKGSTKQITTGIKTIIVVSIIEVIGTILLCILFALQEKRTRFFRGLDRLWWEIILVTATTLLGLAIALCFAIWEYTIEYTQGGITGSTIEMIMTLSYISVPFFIMAFAVCIQTTVWRIRQKNLLDSTFCLGYIRKWSRQAKTRRKLEDEAMSFAQKHARDRIRQYRVLRYILTVGTLACIIMGMSGMNIPSPLLFIAAVIFVFLIRYFSRYSDKYAKEQRDLNMLVDQIERISNGELTATTDISQESAYYEYSQKLTNIGQGMEKALETQMKGERMKIDLITNVSHDLKTPLTSISGFAEIMQGGLVKNEDIPKFAGRIYKESQRLLQLVEDVIQISQLDEEKTSYVWEPVDVYQVCKNAFESLKEKAKRLNVHLYICGERMKMEAVRTLLEEAIYNVCDNAIKYNRNDGSVSVFLTQTAQEIQIVVKDTGVGIPKEDQNRVFERFYRVDKSHSKEIGGTGLGLSIVKHAVGALKGSVILRSEEGNGTEICMKFPKVHKE